MLQLIFALFAILLVTYFWIKRSRPNNFPPGPQRIPFFGDILSLGTKPHLAVQKWKAKYGDVFSFHDGTRHMVVLSDYHTVRRVFGEDSSTGRLDASAIRTADSLHPLGAGLLSSTGQLWKTHRRFALSALRDLGMGKNWLEESIVQEVAGIIQVLKDTQTKPFNPKALVTNSVSNVICALVFGKRFSIEDPKFSRLTGLISENISYIKYDFVAQAMPFLMHFPNPVRNTVQKGRKNVKALGNFMAELIQDHDNTDRDTAVEDYVTAYKDERKKGTKTGEKNTFTDKQLACSVTDLFAAGTETTSTTTLWAMVFMIENPDVMKKVQDEIDGTVGRERMLVNSDRALLPYTEAVVLEVQRVASLVPLAVPHRATEDLTIDGYTIPKDTFMLANLFSIHRDSRLWNDPLRFDPTRFLDKDMKILKPEGFVPFSIGKRACLGEALAKMELFMFIGNILRVFTLQLPAGKSLSSEDYSSSIVLSPSPFELRFIPRI